MTFASPYADKPNTDKKYDSGSTEDVRFAACCIQGWRSTMEDAHAAVPHLGLAVKCSFYAIFDGHEGDTVSNYCATHMIESIMKTDEFSQLKSAESLSYKSSGGLVENGLIKAFLHLDEELRQIASIKAGTDRAGSTAVCALVTPDTIYLANCGDSRGILVAAGAIKLATSDHKPVHATERQRIEKAGGSVMFQRVNGSLAVSRALGDFEYKNNTELAAPEQLVSPQPDITHWSRSPEDEFIVLACDGVWDVMSNEEMCQFIRRQMTTTDDLQRICETLVDTCLHRGSRDNISVVLIALPGAPKVTEESKVAQSETTTAKNIDNVSVEAVDTKKQITEDVQRLGLL
ncbi:protein phosphatase 1B-like [Paramacrobiotus metropolitanus]|uniref:protein phosphatase 1B-like n=1 Tax=Paramacrobiotus metropolitanus TaxID=2943436 RepID=UPI0024462446|nr:protein phosphatase 1B-like [Paramacrobiotus metropolitanus]